MSLKYIQQYIHDGKPSMNVIQQREQPVGRPLRSCHFVPLLIQVDGYEKSPLQTNQLYCYLNHRMNSVNNDLFNKENFFKCDSNYLL